MPTNGSTTVTPSHVDMNGAGWVHAGSLVYHVPHYFPTVSVAKQTRFNPDVLFTYYGGPVLVTPKVYIIFWGYKTYGDPDKVAPLLKTYIKNMGGSSHNNIYTQYYMVTSGSKDVYITNPKPQFGGAWDDLTDAVPSQPSDAQVAAESLEGVKHFGFDVNASYIVATPHGHSTQGFGTQWCAYHSATYESGNTVSYTNLPYMPDAGGNCGANFLNSPPKDESGEDEGVTIVEGHEDGESVTDPIPGSGWYNLQYGEIGDICAWQGIANEQFRKKSYTMQPMFSNASQSCVQTY